MKKIYVGNISYCLGEKERCLKQELDSGINIDWNTTLLANGMKTYFVTERECLTLAKEALEKTLTDSALQLSEVDAIVFSTCSYRAVASRSDLATSSFSLGKYIKDNLFEGDSKNNVDFYVTHLSESGNFCNVLRQAKNLILGEGKQTVLCVLADKIPVFPEQRRGARSGVMINSDVGSSFLVTSWQNQFRIEGIWQEFSPYLCTLDREHKFKKNVEVMRGIKDASTNLLRRLGVLVSDYRFMIMNNYASNLMTQFASYVGFEESKLFKDNLHRFGHAFTSDSVINLESVSTELVAEDRVFILSGGTSNWGVVSLQKT